MPALLVVDFARGWTDSASPMALAVDAEVAAAAALVDAAHAAGARVACTTVAYAEDEEPPIVLLKAPHVRVMTPNSPWVEIDPRLPLRAEDRVIYKRHASAFFDTELAEWLRAAGVDTLLVGGCVTSGCVRASVVDAAQHGFRPLVVREAVADRSQAANEANLADIEQRYGDIITLEEALRLFAAVAA